MSLTLTSGKPLPAVDITSSYMLGLARNTVVWGNMVFSQYGFVKNCNWHFHSRKLSQPNL